MADVWMPRAVRRPQGNGGAMTGGPARAVWHVTWDALASGKQPPFDNVANYLRSADFCPHLMWDPWTGKIVQFYPANQSAKALAHPAGTAETNRMGSACIQVETFFSPGTVREGKKYMTVAETPCKGLPEIMAWLRSWGVPDVWPSGWPEWSGNSRSLANWQNKGGHYGHCHVPANDHTDPGPMPKTMFQENPMALTKDDVAAIYSTDGILDNPTGDKTNLKVKAGWLLTDTNRQVRQLQLMVAALGKGANVDEDAIVKGVLAGLSPAAIAAAIPVELAKQVADELAARLTA